MADITVTLYNFSKRVNSTMLPDNTVTSTTVTVLLKDRCNYETPDLILDSSDPSTYNSYNYCYIDFFARYYFISSKEVDTGNRLLLHLHEDYLGTYKTELLSKTAFIAYSAQGSTDIPENRICTNKNYTVSHADAAFPAAVGGNNYFLSMTGINGVETYHTTRADIKQLFNALTWDVLQTVQGSDEKTTLKNLGDMLGQGLEQVFTQGTVFQNVRSAYILPFPPDEEVLGSPTNIYAGYYDTNIEAEPLVESIFSQAIAISIPWSVADWRRTSPYTSVYLYLPFFGTIDLDANTLTASSYLTVKYSICYSNGDLSYSVETDSNRIIATGKCNVKADYGVGSSNSGILAGLSSAVSEWVPVANATPFIGEQMGGILNTMVAGLQSFGKGFSTNGGLGGFSDCGLDLRLHCWTITKTLTDTQTNFATKFGLPLMQVNSLYSHSGFLQTTDFVFDSANATLNECNAISNMCNKGIYIE